MVLPSTLIWVALIAAVPPTLAAVAALISSRKNTAGLAVVHELVNSRLTAALDKIDALELKLHSLTGTPPTGEPPPLPGRDKPTDLIPRR